MKTYFYIFVFSLTLLSTPIMAAQPTPDPELDVAHQALAAALETVPTPFHSIQCVAYSGGSYTVAFGHQMGQVIVQAVGGSSPRWQVDDQIPDPNSFSLGGTFTSKGKGFQPWKKYVKNLCVICMSDLDSCIGN